MRLFWKILGVYFLAWALLTAMVFSVLLLDLRADFIPRSPISQNLPAALGVQIANTHLRLGDEQSYRQLAEVWKRGQPPYAVDSQGRELLGRAVDPATVALARTMARDDVIAPEPVRRLTDTTGREYVVFYPDGTGPEDRSPLRWVFKWPWLIAVFFAFVGLLLAGGLARAWVRPMAALERSFDRFTEGDEQLELSPKLRNRRDEIGDLARHFDRMARKLNGSLAGQRRLLHDISHELRSPLARLAVALELARRRPEEIETALQRIEKESDRLDRMIREVLTLARIENETAQNGSPAEADEYFDLLELLRVVHDDVQFEAEAVGLRVNLSIPDRQELVLRGRADLLHRAIENVVRNALQHAVDAKTIELHLEAPNEQDRVSIRVADDGTTPPEADLESLFEAFTHGQNSQGFGLGLAIAKRAVAVHGGTIRAAARPTGGVEVVIEIPMDPGQGRRAEEQCKSPTSAF